MSGPSDLTARYAAYDAFTAAYLDRHDGHVRGKCDEATRKMAAAFPELRRACGFVHWDAGHRQVRDQHWWCVTPEGVIVDPTKAQFQGAVPGTLLLYEELDLSKPEDRKRVPTGRCMDCGADAYDHNNFCSDACEKAHIEWMEKGCP